MMDARLHRNPISMSQSSAATGASTSHKVVIEQLSASMDQSRPPICGAAAARSFSLAVQHSSSKAKPTSSADFVLRATSDHAEPLHFRRSPRSFHTSPPTGAVGTRTGEDGRLLEQGRTNRRKKRAVGCAELAARHTSSEECMVGRARTGNGAESRGDIVAVSGWVSVRPRMQSLGRHGSCVRAGRSGGRPAVATQLPTAARTPHREPRVWY